VHEPDDVYTGEAELFVELTTTNVVPYAALAGAPLNVVVGAPGVALVVWVIVAAK